MLGIEQADVPCDSLLKSHLGKSPERWRGYQDCFRVRVTRRVELGEFVVAFYTTPLFKLERLLLFALLGIRSSDADAAALMAGAGHTFAAWYEGARNPHELLMCDCNETTRSWFMVEAAGEDTWLCFGSAVASRPDERAMPARFHWLLGLHVLYSKLLLASAVGRLTRNARDRSVRKT